MEGDCFYQVKQYSDRLDIALFITYCFSAVLLLAVFTYLIKIKANWLSILLTACEIFAFSSKGFVMTSMTNLDQSSIMVS